MKPANVLKAAYLQDFSDDPELHDYLSAVACSSVVSHDTVAGLVRDGFDNPEVPALFAWMEHHALALVITN